MSVKSRKNSKKNKSLKNKQKADTYNGGQKSWSCSKCAKSFSAERQWRRHRKEFHKRVIKSDQFEYFYDQGEDIYFCDNCTTRCKSQSEMEAHVKTHVQYICFVCDDSFYSLYKFSVHNQTHEPGCFRCPLCDYQTNKRCLIQNHINTTHLSKFRHTCDVCGEGFQDVAHYKEHKEKHAGAQAISCIVCQKEYQFRSRLLTHQKRSHTVHIGGVTSDRCKICKINFKSPFYLQRHMLRHETKQEHLCDVCGKTFSTKALLILHRTMHADIKEYKCGYCTKAFTQKKYLVMHERVHTGERPFACEYCEKAFTQRTSLKRHIRGHTGERPYVCHICKKGFISKDTLNLHFKSCNG